MKKVLVLGASGFLGGRILRELQSQSEVEALGTYCRSGSLGLKQLDVTAEGEFAKLYESFQPAVVIWSVMSGVNEDDLISRGLPRVVESLDPATKLVYLSTDGVFSDGLGNYNETHQPSYMQVDTPLAHYSNAKLQGEELILKCHSEHVIVRTGPIYGTDVNGEWDKRIAQLIEELTAGRQIVRSTNLYRSFIHVEDLAKATAEIAIGELSGYLHVGPDQKESYYTFNRKMAIKLGLPADLVVGSTVDPVEAKEKGLPLDTSLDTFHARSSLRTIFRRV
ncbi:sugar nucleotide-binding protein [Brevibacillus ginsengisoli]|uniref:sugar nucleotide-binding protein n=1 Tax=Brevibacillus ginsengisoli TaxID=363854 RepID=UPI003CEE3409